MIRMKAEAVVITKPDQNTGLNGANINMNGKVLFADAADKGYKGAGTLNGEVVLCLASGDRENNVAETAMNILTQHIPAIKKSGNSFASEADSYFNHAFRELSMQNGAYETFSATLLYNYTDKVYIANTGDNAVYSFDGMYLDQIRFDSADPKKKEDDLPTADINCKMVSDVKPGTQIIVLSKEIYEYTTDEQILDILRNAVSVKQACQQLINQAAENGAESYTAVLIENLTPTEVPMAGVSSAKPENVDDAEIDDDSDEELDLTKPSKAPLIILILLLILVALVAGVYFANQKYDFIDKFMSGKTTVQETSTEPSANIITLPSTTKSSVTTSGSMSTNTTIQNTTETTQRSTTTTRRSTANNSYEEEEDEPVYNPVTDPPEEPVAEPSNEEPSNEEPSNDEPSNDEPSNEESNPTPNEPENDPPANNDDNELV